MNSLFWERAHGGLTHFPIALIFAAAFVDALAFVRRRNDFTAVGYWLTILAAIGSVGAVFSGLGLNKWKFGGTGLVYIHHLLVWPSFILILALATWRLTARNQFSRRAFRLYVVVTFVTCGLIGGAGFVGGEMLLGNSELLTTPVTSPVATGEAVEGRHLFLMNCAHCHGDDARGDEGPDLHDLHKTDTRIHQVIIGGIKGEMPSFAKKLGEPEVRQLTAYLRTLRT